VVNNPRQRLIDFRACANMAVAAHAEQMIAAGFVLETRGDDRERLSMSKPRISYVEPASIKDEAMLAELDRCAAKARRAGEPGDPRPCAAVFWSFANSWRDVFKNGVPITHQGTVPHYVSRSVRSSSAATSAPSRRGSGHHRGGLPDLINFETRAARRATEARCPTRGNHLGSAGRRQVLVRLREHSASRTGRDRLFRRLDHGQQRWLRTLDIEHHQVLAAPLHPWRRASRRGGAQTLEAGERLLANRSPKSQTRAAE